MRAWRWACAVTFLGVLALFMVARHAATGSLYFAGTHEPSGIVLHLPMQIGNAHLWREGLPTWNPWSACGTPQLGNLQSAVLYPLNALFLFLPPLTAAELVLVLRLIALGAACYALARSFQLAPASGLLLALWVVFNNWQQRYANNAIVNSDLLLPLTALVYVRLGATGGVRTGVAAALLTALHVLAGMPEAACFSFGFVSLLYLHSAFLGEGRRAWGGSARKLGLLAAVLAGGALLSAVQVLPFLEYLRHAYSPHLEAPTYWAHRAPRASAPGLAYPFLETAPPSSVVTVTFGALVILFALRGLARPLAGGWNYALGAFCLLGTLKVFGVEPLHSLGRLPVLETLAFPLYLSGPLRLSAAALAAMGFDDWWRRPRDLRALWPWLLAVPALAWCWSAGRGGSASVLAFYPCALLSISVLAVGLGIARARSSAARPWWALAPLLVLSVGELWLHHSQVQWNPGNEVLRQGLLEGRAEAVADFLDEPATGGERFTIAGTKVPNAPLFWGPRPGFDYVDVIQVERYWDFSAQIGLDSLQGDEASAERELRLLGAAAVGHVVLNGAAERQQTQGLINWLGPKRFKTWRGPGPPESAREEGRQRWYLGLPCELELAKIDLSAYRAVSLLWRVEGDLADPVEVSLSLGERWPAAAARATRAPGDERWRSLRLEVPSGLGRASLALSVAGPRDGDARLVIDDLRLHRTLHFPELDLKPAGDLGNLHFYRNERALPRARVVHAAHVVERYDDALAALSTVDLGTTAVLEAAPGIALPGADGPGSTARVVLSRAKRVVVEVEGSRDGLLLLADTYYPGWIARVDGVPRPIQPANLMFRAVPVEAGRHVVEFEYRPWSVRAGAVLSLLACAAAAAVFRTRQLEPATNRRKPRSVSGGL